MTVARLFVRVFGYLQRFCVACENFGFLSAIKLFVYHRWKSVQQGISLPVKKLRRTIVFRGQMDGGVLSHFYGPGYRIRDTVKNPVRVIVDAGANIGCETLRFRHFFPDATIVAIEAAAGNYKILFRNVGSDPAIKVLNRGLWSHECKLRVLPGESAEAFHVVEVESNLEPADVDAISVSSVMNQFSFDEIDILKMDIEGAEDEVFSSPDVAEWIGRVKALIFECPDADRPGTTQRIFSRLPGNSFNCYIHGECFVMIRKDTGWTLESNTYF